VYGYFKFSIISTVAVIPLLLLLVALFPTCHSIGCGAAGFLLALMIYLAVYFNSWFATIIYHFSKDRSKEKVNFKLTYAYLSLLPLVLAALLYAWLELS
jgi:membrane-bound metal-dependent hydrolase YbcI (DUF457 family)